MSPTVPKARVTPQLPAPGMLRSRACSRRHHHRMDVTVPCPPAQSRQLRGSDGQSRVSPSRWERPHLQVGRAEVTLLLWAQGQG